MTLYQQKGFEVVKGFIPPFFAQYLKNYFTLRVQNDPSLKGDTQAENSACVYGDPAFDMVMAMSCPLVEKILGKRLIPQYTYARIYYDGSVLEKHRDRPECQHSISLSLGQEADKLWPLWIEDRDGKQHASNLEAGDALIYNGTELTHWRDKFEGTSQHQLFMHYVDADGEFKNRVFDGRPNLGLPK